jgi:hypothetical protein
MNKVGGALLAVAFTLAIIERAAAGALNVSVALIPAGTAVDLTAQGTADWIHWGLLNDTSLNRKANVASRLSDFSPVAAPGGYVYTFRFADNANGYTWTDGTPTASVNNTPTGIWAYGSPVEGTGFRLNVPASTNSQTLKVYVGAFDARATFIAYLSDGSASGYTNSTAIDNTGNGPSRVVTINFEAATPNQSLHVLYTLNLNRARGQGGDGNVTLQAAALSSAGNTLPFVALASPPDRASFDSSGMVLTANAADSDGTIAFVEFYDGTNKLAEADESPYSIPWTNPPPGIHLLSARAIDNSGGVSTSATNLVYVNGDGGLLAGTRADAPSSVNLTSEGTKDWAHWGSFTASSFDHKAAGDSQISNFTLIGTNAPARYSDNLTGFGWSDGTPLGSTNGSTTGIQVQGINNGFEIQAPADGRLRTLKVYAGLYGAQANFEAFLSDFSGQAFTDITLSNTFGKRAVVYSIAYAAASPGQRLIVRQTMRKPLDTAYGNVTLQAATLQESPNVAPSISITNPLNNSILPAPATFTASAAAFDADGSVTNVEFVLGATSVGMAATAPYEVTLADVPSGEYVLSAIATDNEGARNTNQVAFTVNERPSISITNPSDGIILAAPASFTVQAVASDADGSVMNVEFLLGANSMGAVASAPYEVSLADVSAGQYVVSAIATDNDGARSTNRIAVTVNERPSISITNPSNGASFPAPAAFLIEAAASDADGVVTNVQFFSGTTEIGAAFAPPFQTFVTNLAAGNYVFSAKSTDNLGACTTSAPISVLVRALPTPQSLTIPNLAGGDFVFSFPTEPDALYTIEFSESLNPVNWQPLTNFPGDGTSLSFTNQIEGKSERYFRLRIQ